MRQLIRPVLLVCTIAAVFSMAAAARSEAAVRETPPQKPAAAQLKVFLDCDNCFSDYLRTSVEFVDYVRDRTEAEVHVLVTRADTAAGGFEYTLAFIGRGRLDGVTDTLKAVTEIAASDDTIRRQLATSLRAGLLRFLTRDGVPPSLDLEVKLGSEEERPAVSGDRWRNWVFTLQGSASFNGEESSRQRELGASVSADRITPDWKITLGLEIDHEHEEFDLDEDEPVSVERRERDFNWLIVKALGEHWSLGARGDIESSTFENIELAFAAAPAVEFNFFPYSQYTRRQLRAQYTVGVNSYRYYEVTLYGELEETRPAHELSLTLEQRERWGSIEATLEWSQFLHDLSKARLEANGEISLRIARGLSVSAEVNASRIRDQLSIPARGATDEEILLRLRRLESGYEYNVAFNLTYTFGSIFSSIVNPRFGQ
jgi:hypothetical protein